MNTANIIPWLYTQQSLRRRRQAEERRERETSDHICTYYNGIYIRSAKKDYDAIRRSIVVEKLYYDTLNAMRSMDNKREVDSHD